ncbi:MAG: primosomal protein N' [Oscillospiraceae bacterium]
MTGLAAEVALDGATNAYDRLYSYALPKNCGAVPGCRVTVPFGKGNIKKQGMIFSVCETQTDNLKEIISVTDKKPVLTREMLELCLFLREHYFCTYYDAVHAALPAGLNYRLVNNFSANEDFSALSFGRYRKSGFDYLLKSGEKEKVRLDVSSALLRYTGGNVRKALFKNRESRRRVNDAGEKRVRAALTDDVNEEKLTPRQREIFNFVREAGSISIKELRYFTGVSAGVTDKLIAEGFLIPYEKRVFRTVIKQGLEAEQTEISLTDEQQAAYDGMTAEYEKNEGAVSLLYGVTGSGKTQVFLKLADRVIADNRGVIVMVPEISLTPQLLGIFASRYGDKIAVFHSAMSMGKRMDEWQRVKNGDALIAVGTRSAIFAPFENLGLIIIDEEQEHTYKSEQSPRFHARTLARFRAKYNKALLCLASATPSVESFTAAKSGRYSLYRLKNRFGGAVLPQVETVDMKQEILSGNSSLISRRLYEKLTEVLEEKKQAILLLNRRGHNTYVSCPECGYVMSCPNCSISLTYHSANHRLMCHYCGYSVPRGDKCPECGGQHMKFLGAGTQKVEEELKNLFPSARVLRLDADSTMAADSYAMYLEAFAAGEYDILLGTQMVAKGLDFPNVTLVGVLGADSATYSEDFRSFERTFSLLTQVVGRAGRGGDRGLAIIQSMNPESSVIKLAARQDYDGFYEEEIMTRRLMVYPPYCDICAVISRAADRAAAEKAITDVFRAIRGMLEDEYKDVKLIILGPSPASVPRVNGKYRYRMIIKCREGKRFRELLRRALDIKLTKDATVSADMNPETVI